MKFCTSAFLILLTTLFVVAQEERVTLRGVVTDRNHASIPNVRISAESNPGKVFSTITNENGEYLISLPKGDYVLKYNPGRGNHLWAERTLVGYIQGPSFKEAYDITVALGINSEGAMVTETVAFPVEPGKNTPPARSECRLVRRDNAILSGTAFDINGAVITETLVKATNGEKTVYSAKTNSEGVYSLNLPKGEYKIEFLRQHFRVGGYENFKVDEGSFGERNLDIILFAFENINSIEVSLNRQQ